VFVAGAIDQHPYSPGEGESCSVCRASDDAGNHDAPEDRPPTEPAGPTIQQRHERLTPRQRSKVNAAATKALLSPMAPDLSSADVAGWEMVLDEHEASRPPPFPDPDETGVPGNSNEAS
jgi:hypothetical protein